MDYQTAAACAREAKRTLVAQLQQCITIGSAAASLATTRMYCKLLSRIALALDYTAAVPQPRQQQVSAEQLAREMLALQLAPVGHEDDDADNSATSSTTATTTTIDSLFSHELHTLARVGAALRTLHNVRAERVVAAQLYLLLVAPPPLPSSNSTADDDSSSGSDHRENGFARQYLTRVLTDGGGAGVDLLTCSDAQQTLDSVARHLNDTNRRDIICELASYIRDAHVIQHAT